MAVEGIVMEVTIKNLKHARGMRGVWGGGGVFGGLGLCVRGTAVAKE